MFYIYTVNVLFLLPSSHRINIGCSWSSDGRVGNLGAAGRSAAVTDGEINRLDNRV